MSVASTSPAASPKPSAVKRQVELPFGKAYEFALRSIKIRFWRSMITAG
ncbi:MAG: ABC transporter permease, partial [Cytophagales bacterium]|nr:ABC transporter permease [Armatimonadota bacterium]